MTRPLAAALLLLAAPLAARADLPGHDGFLTSGGVKLHFVEAGKGPLVVLLHGFPDFWYTWRDQMPALAKTHHVVALDLRGYNYSDQPQKVDDYALDRLVADVAAVLDHFKAPRATLVGHDWGGAIAWAFAMKYPDRTTRLVVLNLPHPRGLLRELAHNLDQQKASAYARAFQAPDAAKALRPEVLAAWVKEPAARALYVEALKRSSPEGMLNYYKANYPREPYRDDASFPPVRCPVLLIHGLKDPYLLPAALDGTWRWVDKDLTLLTVPTAGHFVHRDEPALVTRTIVRWLGQAEPR